MINIYYDGDTLEEHCYGYELYLIRFFKVQDFKSGKGVVLH